MSDDTIRTDQFRAELTAVIPALRAFARALVANDRDLADDLAQEALAKAWAARASYTPGTNFKAWIFRILRNHFYTTSKVAQRFVVMEPQFANDRLLQRPTQGSGIGIEDIERGLAGLSAKQREVLMLLASGLQWDEIATIIDRPIGTVKSRITRGRAALRAYLDGPDEDAAITDSAPPGEAAKDASGAARELQARQVCASPKF